MKLYGTIRSKLKLVSIAVLILLVVFTAIPPVHLMAESAPRPLPILRPVEKSKPKVIPPVEVKGSDNKQDKTEQETSSAPENTPKTEQEVTKTEPVKATYPLAVTFDDGPSAHTARLLDALRDYGAKATFFVVGQSIPGREDLLERMIKEGHQIGNHSYHHPNLTTLDATSIANQLSWTSSLIEQASGISPHILRPPYGSFNQAVIQEASVAGMGLVLWSVDTQDWKHTHNADVVYQTILDQAYSGAIILLHDLHSSSVDAFIRALPELVRRGYSLVTIDELLTIQPGEITPASWAY